MRIASARPCLTIAALATLAWAGHADAGYRLVDLGSISSPDPVRVNGFNASGDAVGTRSPSPGLASAVRRTSGEDGFEVALPGVHGPSSGVAINASGDITGAFYDPRGGNKSHAFRVVDGQFQDLGTLPGGSAAGTAINDDGDIAGEITFAGAGPRAFRSIAGGVLTLIDPLAGGSWNQATGINASGTVVGSSDIGYQIARAFVAGTTGPAVDLLSLHPGSSFSGSTYATAISDRGAIVGHGDFGSGSHAFLAPASGPLIDLGLLGTARSSFAYGVNDRMQVVGALDHGGNVLRAFAWDATTGMIDLNTLLDDVDRKAWVLSEAMAIGDTGQIAGLGYRGGELHGFLLVPGATPFATPAPPAWALASVGGGIVAGWARFRRGRTRVRAGV